MTRKLIYELLLLGFAGVFIWSCSSDTQDEDALALEDPLMEVAEMSTQISSGTDVTFSRGSTGNSYGGFGTGMGRRPNGNYNGQRPQEFGQGNEFRKYKDEKLQVISMAEKIGERMNFWMFKSIGADVTHYDENGNVLEVEYTGRPDHGQWREGTAPKMAKTVIAFGSGVSLSRGDFTLDMSGGITIDRSFDNEQLTQAIAFDNFIFNGNSIAGTKTITKSFNEESGQGVLNASVSEGLITFSDGSTSTWESSKSRTILVVIEEEGERPTSAHASSEGETTITQQDGTVLYSHKTTTPIESDMACSSNGRGRKPSSGVVETNYDGNVIVVDFGDGDCSDIIVVTINGEDVEISG